jgi:hypothetical protein
LGRFEGRPAAQKVTEQGGIFVLKPLQHLRERVFQSTGEAVGNPYFIPECLASAQSIPTKAANVSCDGGVMRHLLKCVRVVRRDMGADVLRRHYREPVTRQTLSIRG